MSVANELIVFEPKDFLPQDMQYFQKNITRIAYHVNNHPYFLGTLADFLLTFINKISFSAKYKKWKHELPPIDIYYGAKIAEDFISDLYKTFNALKDDHVDKFRGLLFEKIMEIFLKKRYAKKGDKFSTGCLVIINGDVIEYICSEDVELNRKTIDIAAHNNSSSIFYELKVGPEGFANNVIKYLNILHNKTNTHKISDDIIIGCMTLKSKRNLLSRLKLNNENYSNLQINGIRELESLFTATS